MSGDVQPRKRRDKRRKRDDRKSEGELLFSRQSSVQEDDESSHGVHLTKMGTDDVHLHVHHEHETGGHWCAKILFFALLALLLGLVSLIIMENRGLSDLDTPLSESRFSNYFDGWVDEKRESHDESAHGSIEDHNDHDDDHDDEPYDEDEEPLSEVDEEDVTGENDEEEEHDEDENNDADEDYNKYEDERNTQEAADDNDEDNSKELGEDDNDENDDETATQEDDDNNTVEQEDDDDTRQNSADPFDEDDDDDDDDASAQVTKEQSQNSADPFDEDDDDDDDDDTFEIFEKVVENDAEELLLLQQKAAEMAAKNPTPTSAEAEEDNQAADEESSLLGKNDLPTEAMMRRRLTIAGPEDTFPEDENAPILPKDELDIEEEVETIEFIEEEIEESVDEEEYEEEEEEEEIEVDEDGIEIERSGKYMPETFEELNEMYRAREIKERSPHPMTRNITPPHVVHHTASPKITPPRDFSLRVPETRVTQQQQQQQQKAPPIFIAPPPPQPSPTINIVERRHYMEEPATSAAKSNNASNSPITDARKKNTTHDLDYQQDSYYNDEPYDSDEYSGDEDYEDEGDIEQDISDISDVDDAELLDRLEAKYGKLPMKTKSADDYESDEDPDDPTWTQIKPKTTTDSGGGGQDFDDDADDSFEAQLNRAKAELERENFAAAYVAYSKLSKDYADQPQAFFGKCKSLYELNKRDESKIHANAVFYSCKRYLAFDELIKNNEEYRTIAEITLNVIEELGVLLQARDIYDGLRLRFPEDAELLKKYALNEIKRQAYTAAEKLLQIVLKSNPKDGFALAHMGLILKLCDDNYKAALPLLRKGIESKENGTQNAFLYIQLGETYQRLSMNEEAQKVYEKAAQLKLIPSALQRPIHYEPKLRAQPFWSVEETANKFHFQNLQENWKSIRQEGMKALNMQRLFKNESENLREYGTWKMFEIFTRGNRHDQNCKVTPKTCALIDTFPAARKCRQGQVKFSILQPKTHIWSHCGPTNTRLRAHLGLTVPKGAHIRVAKENRTWSEGEFLIFDDSFEHEVWHEGEHNRLVLIIDIWHPDLTEEQRQNLPTI